MNREKLAIVIPAYKEEFFEKSIESIANQTCLDFTLYIGIDNSPGNLEEIILQQQHKVQIIYKSFDENLGRKDLVAQWERCVDLVGDEEWVWLFSDDDVMDTTCVESFYRTLDEYPGFDLFHFNVLKIDEHDNVIGNFYSFPEILSSEDFLLGKLKVSYFSTVVEYVFRKSHFIEQGRFQKFDMAWGSDDATWIKLGKNRGIRNVEGSKVYWRHSLLNISSIVKDREIVTRKLNAQIEFSTWIRERAKQGYLELSDAFLQQQLKEWFMRTIISRIEILPHILVSSMVRNFFKACEINGTPNRQILFLHSYKIYRLLIRFIKSIYSAPLKGRGIESGMK